MNKRQHRNLKKFVNTELSTDPNRYAIQEKIKESLKNSIHDRFSDVISPETIDQPEVRGYLKKMNESKTGTVGGDVGDELYHINRKSFEQHVKNQYDLLLDILHKVDGNLIIEHHLRKGVKGLS